MEATSQFRLAKVGNTCLELIADGDIDQEVTAGVDNEKPVVERRSAKEPDRGSEFCKRTFELSKLWVLGCIHLLNTCKYYDNTRK